MSDTNQVGKRYECSHCGTQLMCVKSGPGHFECHDAPMSLVGAKPLPSSD